MSPRYAPKHSASAEGARDQQPGFARGRAPEKAKGASHMAVVTPKPYGEPTERRRLRLGRALGIGLIVVAVALLAVAAGLFLDAYLKYADQDRVNEQLAAYAEVRDDDAQTGEAVPEGSRAPVVDWAGLKAIDPNVCAWLQIPDTPINFPVYQGSDNDYYLNTNAYGEYGVGGQVFLDCENANPGLVDEQTVVYGHHLQNGAMFAYLAEFDNQAVFDSHNTVWYVTEAQAFELEPLLCYRTQGTDENVRLFQWPTTDEFHAYLDGLLEKAQASRKDAAKIIDGVDHVLTLSTCSYEEENGRTLLVCVPKDEASAARLAG